MIFCLRPGHFLLSLSARLSARIAEEAYADVLESIQRVKPMLQELHQEYSLALVSNFGGNLETVVAELGIDSLFQAVIDSTVVGIAKPDPGIFALTLEQMGIRADEAVMVGDSYDRDIEPAKALGLATVFLHGRSWKQPVSTEKADHIIKSIFELPSVLDMIR